jgi:hypothetical protein
MPVFFRVHEAAVHSFNAPGQPVYNEIDNVAKMAQFFAVQNLVGHTRTGQLAKNIRANKPKPEGGYRIAALVYANIKYAYWHHEGTDPIFPKNGAFLVIPKQRQGGGSNPSGQDLKARHRKGQTRLYTTRKWVRGQKGNPYLRDGLEEAMGRSKYLTFT